jgi:hypothetical protein
MHKTTFNTKMRAKNFRSFFDKKKLVAILHPTLKNSAFSKCCLFKIKNKSKPILCAKVDNKNIKKNPMSHSKAKLEKINKIYKRILFFNKKVVKNGR